MNRSIPLGSPGHAGRLVCLVGVVCLSLSAAAAAAGGKHHEPMPHARVMASGLAGPTGATVGPDGALYVAEGAIGRIARVDPVRGHDETVAEQLPAALPGVGLGGVMDVAFLGDELYMLVALQFGTFADGIYRVTGPTSFELVADLGQFNLDHPVPDPDFQIDLPGGVLFSLDSIDQGFLVSDGHLNRLVHVIPGDPPQITLFQQFSNTVPTGMAGDFGTLNVAMLGSVEVPDDAGVSAMGLLQPDNVREVASGYPMIVDVELGPDGRLYALSQGDIGSDVAGAPAAPGTGRLLRVREDGSFELLAAGLDLPTSINFTCTGLNVVTLAGQVLRYRHLAGFGPRHLDRCR